MDPVLLSFEFSLYYLYLLGTSLYFTRPVLYFLKNCKEVYNWLVVYHKNCNVFHRDCSNEEYVKLLFSTGEQSYKKWHDQ